MTRDELWEFLQARAQAWQTGDLDLIEAGYSPDVVLIAPGGIRVEGTAALRENNARYLAEYTDIRVELTRVILDGNQGALQWTWSETRRSDGQRRSVDDAIIFELRDGKIVYWHEYFDTAALA